QPREPSSGELLGSLVAGANSGIAGLVGLPVDTAQNIYNLAKAGLGVATGRPQDFPLVENTPGGSDSIRRAMESMRINTENPRPDDPLARMAYTGGVIGGGSMVPGSSVKGTLAAAAGGALAGEALGPQYTGIGAMVPAAGRMAGVDLKNAVASRVAPNV